MAMAQACMCDVQQEGWKAVAAAASVPQSPITSPRQQLVKLPVHAEVTEEREQGGKWERGRNREGRGGSAGEHITTPENGNTAQSEPLPISGSGRYGRSEEQQQPDGHSPKGDATAGWDGRSPQPPDCPVGSVESVSSIEALQSPFSALAQQPEHSTGKPPIVGRHLATVRIADDSSVGSSDMLPRPLVSRSMHSVASSNAAAKESRYAAQDVDARQPLNPPSQRGGAAHAASGNIDMGTVADAILGPTDIPGTSEAHVASGGAAGGLDGGAGPPTLGKAARAIPTLINGAVNTAREAAEGGALPPRPTVNTRSGADGGGGGFLSRIAGDSPQFSNISEGVPLSFPSESLASAYESEAGGNALRGKWAGGEEEWPPPMTRSGRRRLRCAMLVRLCFLHICDRPSVILVSSCLLSTSDSELVEGGLAGRGRASPCEEAVAGQAASEVGASGLSVSSTRVLQGPDCKDLSSLYNS